MDLILSIPVLSYFLSPSVAPYSTSLNILFFYMTWSTLVLSHSPLTVHLFGTLAIRVLFFFLPSLLFLLFDLSVPSLAEAIKHGGRSALPPRNVKFLSRLMGLVLMNLALMTVAEYGLSFIYMRALGHTAFKTTTTLPLPWQMFKHVLILMTTREVLHYYINRMVLHGTSCRSVAKKHREYSHSRRGAPFSMQLMADHPIPLMIDHFLPIYLPAMFLRPHLLTYFLFVMICTIEETTAMCGYTTVPGFILGGITRRTARHYGAGGKGHYGRLGVLDWANSTDNEKHVQEEEEESNHAETTGMVTRKKSLKKA